MENNQMNGVNMDSVNQMNGGVSNSGKGKLVGLLLGALGVAGGYAAVKFLKNRKNKKSVEEAEYIEAVTEDVE